MPKNTNENLGDIKHKLDFLGLNLDKIPKEFKEYEYLDFKPSRNYEENLYKVYKYVPINKIQILLTPTNRMDTLYEKYSKSSPIYNYLVPDNEENVLNHTTFLKMLNDMNIQEIENIEQEQKRYEKNIPFKIKYSDNYLWQIYYSEATGIYFMLVPTKEQDSSTFFYILKKQLENSKKKKDEEIFVPISNLEYSREYLNKEEVQDIEKYLWLFTKDWANIYEVHDRNNDITIQIVGNTFVYEKIQSFYKIKLDNKEDIAKFYKLIKALFILQTELPHNYKFDVQISSKGDLDFLYKNKIINYDNLSSFIQEEYKASLEAIKNLKVEEKGLKEELEVLKILSNKKDKEYIYKEKQIATFLECKKSFLGKVRYFFKGKKKNKKENEVVAEVTKKEEQENNEIEEDEEIKEYYTIDDLLKLSKNLDEIDTLVKNMKLDISALKRKIELMDTKIANADTYIKEIESHKKSIFEFWKFANKDNVLALNEGIENSNTQNLVNLHKTFDYEEDFEDFANAIDKIQRNNFEKQECDSIYLMYFDNILKDINSIKLDNRNDLEKSLEQLKDEAEREEMLFQKEEFDIFGGIVEDKTKISVLNNKKHRETKKNKFKILDITKNTTVQEYQNKLISALKNLNESYNKIKLDADMHIYMACDGSINGKEFGVFNINPENALNKCKELDKINLYRINLKENMPVIAFSNIIFYDNFNKTLPLGMGVSDEILIDMNQFCFELKRQKLFRINYVKDDINIDTKIICVYEYDVEEVK